MLRFIQDGRLGAGDRVRGSTAYGRPRPYVATSPRCSLWGGSRRCLPANAKAMMR